MTCTAEFAGSAVRTTVVNTWKLKKGVKGKNTKPQTFTSKAKPVC